MPPLDAWLHPTVQAALVGGSVAAFGWLVNGAQNRRREARLRHERVADVQRALIAEIRANLLATDADDIAQTGAEVVARIREGDFLPLVPTEANDRIFRAILSDIHVLPAETIDSVVLYYRQLGVMAALAADFRQIDIESAERAAEMFEDYVALSIEAVQIGGDALSTLAASLEGGSAAVSRPAAARSGL